MDVELEKASAQLDEFIERRAQGRTGRDAANERARLLEESVARHHARKRRQNRAAWYEYFCRQAENHRKLSENYERRAEELCKEGAA